MKKIILFITISYCYNVYSQTEKSFYVDDKENYIVLLDKDIKPSKKNVEGTEVNVFVKMSEMGFNYTLLISKIFDHDFLEGNLLGDSYIKYFSDTCECTVLENEVITYNNLRGLRFKIKVQNKENIFIGYNDSFVSGDLLYNILFLTFENDFDKQQKKYSPNTWL